jgi:hypothetical protein
MEGRGPFAVRHFNARSVKVPVFEQSLPEDTSIGVQKLVRGRGKARNYARCRYLGEISLVSALDVRTVAQASPAA